MSCVVLRNFFERYFPIEQLHYGVVATPKLAFDLSGPRLGVYA